MEIAKSTEVITYEVKQTITALDASYKAWLEHVKTGEGMLYSLLEECLTFHNFLLTNDEHQTAFKGFCRFNWHKSTPLMTLVAKQVFGHKNKQVYDYIKALNAAFAQGIGADGAMGLAQWLKENGGISGVISANKKPTKAEIERSFRIHVAGNAEQFGLVDRLSSFTSMEMAAAIEHGSGDIVILATVDRHTGKFQPKLISEDVPLRNKLWELRGEAIMETSEYHRNKDAFLEKLRQKNAVTAAKVANAFNKINSPKKTEEHVALISKVCVNA